MGIGEELVAQLNGDIPVFCCGAGTGGMLVGVSRALNAAGCKTKIVALEPAGSPLLRVDARINSQIRSDGVVPFREYVAVFQAER
jgi:cysteine synthase